MAVRHGASSSRKCRASSPTVRCRTSSAASGNLASSSLREGRAQFGGYCTGCSQAWTSLRASENASPAAMHAILKLSDMDCEMRSGVFGQMAFRYGDARFLQYSARCSPAPSTPEPVSPRHVPVRLVAVLAWRAPARGSRRHPPNRVRRMPAAPRTVRCAGRA